MKKLQLIQRVDKIVGLIFPTPEECEKQSKWLALREHGQLVQVTLQDWSPPKTNPQLAYYYGVIIPFAKQVFWESQGDDSIPGFTINGEAVRATKETLDVFFKSMYERYQLSDEISKESMSIEEMGKFMDWIGKWFFNTYGIMPPEAKHETL